MSLELTVICLVLAAISAGFVALFLKAFYEKTFTKALALKGVASICFVAIGAIACFSKEISTVSILIFVGLCFGLIGDEVIALCQVYPKHDTLAFIGGGSFFVVGHILYIISLFLLGKLSVGAIIISFAIMAILSLIYEKHRSFLSGDMKIPLSLYLGIVIFMGAVAIGVFFKRFTLGAGLFGLGGILFAISDNILFAYKLGEKPRFIQNIALHVAYYLAQILIAFGIAWI